MKVFEKSFTQQESISETAIAKAVEVMRTGRLHRYNAIADERTETELLESEFASYLGVPYCLACASGGYALNVALRSAGVENGDKVLCNAFTLSPVPGAIHSAGGRPVFVETRDDYTIDTEHLKRMTDVTQARFLLLSHMRGHIGDMDSIVQICTDHGVVLIEDCAHTMGATWKGRKSGTFGKVACFSTQTYKHLNSGEGGFLTTSDKSIICRAILLSGSYMLYGRHIAAPEEEDFAEIRFRTPNCSGRMDNLRAAILRVQLEELEENCRRWNARYRALEAGLRRLPGVWLPDRPEHEHYVGSSIQFSLPGYSESAARDFLARCAARGVEVKWFGDKEPLGYTSRYDSWRYLDDTVDLPRTNDVLATLCDMRVPLTFEVEDCALIAEIIGEVVTEMTELGPPRARHA